MYSKGVSTDNRTRIKRAQRKKAKERELVRASEIVEKFSIDVCFLRNLPPIVPLFDWSSIPSCCDPAAEFTEVFVVCC